MIDVIETTTSAPPSTRPRFFLLYAVLGLVAGGLLMRSAQLQLWQGAALRLSADDNRVTATQLTAPRGIFYDVNGEQLVENVATSQAVIDPRQLPDEISDSFLATLAAITSASETEIIAAIQSAQATGRITRVASALEHEAVLELERQRALLPGIDLVSSLVRRYPNGEEMSPVLGYASLVSEADLAQRPYTNPTDIAGKVGLEATYDEPLHGQHGVSYVEINVSGSPQREVRRVDPTPGHDIQLTLDAALQREIVELLRSYQGERAEADKLTSGAVVALDPRSGAVRALVSFPSYEPNVFSQPSLRDQVSATISDERQLLFNRAIGGTYPPGSTIKPLIAAAALEEGVITPDTTFASTGGINVGVWHFPDWKAGGHGITDVKKAIAESVNTFFYLIAGGDENVVSLGVNRLTHYLALFGWGQPTGIDIPQEAGGFLPSPEWKAEVKSEPWYIGDTYHLGIGQGDVLATPLQVAAATASIANNGVWSQPHLANALISPDGDAVPTEMVQQPLDITPSAIATVRAGMRQTVTDGSGRSLRSLPAPLAGKTGTAQIGGTEDTHAWFTSFGPYEEPELVLTVLLERGGGGDTDAVPFARDIWRWWLENRKGLSGAIEPVVPVQAVNAP